MPIDPYQNCPCGSGKKFKWCCQRLAKYAEKAEQLLEKDQPAAALQAIDEGLAVDAGSLWLRTMKAEVLLGQHDHDPGHELLAAVLADRPDYVPALTLRLQDQIVHHEAAAAVVTLEQLLQAATGDQREAALGWAAIVGRALGELGHPFAALKHLRFVAEHDEWRDELMRDIIAIERDGGVPPWLRDSHELRPDAIRDGATGPRWQEALALAAGGRWAAAAAIFADIAAEQPGRPAAWFNLGLCRAWAADEAAAADALHRYATLETDEQQAIDAEALAQSLDPRDSAQSVDVVRVRYPIRDRSRLIQNLKEHPRLQARFLDAGEDQGEPDVRDEFFLLDQPAPKEIETAPPEKLPLVIGIVRTRGNELELEFADPASDDPRPTLALEAAGDAVERDGQREVAGTMPVSLHRLRRFRAVPPKIRPEIATQVRRAVHEQLYRDVWPDTPLGWLNNETPRQAAQSADLRRSLRVAVLLVESSVESFDIDIDPLRDQLGLPREPVLDGPDLDVDRLPLARLRQVRAERLSTPRLRALFERGVHFTLPRAAQNAAAVLVTRPAERDQFDATSAFKLLIDYAGRRSDREAATDWLQRARRFDAETGQPERPTWDVSEWFISFQCGSVQQWAPNLAGLLARVGKDKEVAGELMGMLVAVGLVRLVAHPSEPDRVVLDTYVLDQILARFGAPSASPLDLTPVAATGPGKLWTPDSGHPAPAAGAPGGVWSPGQPQPTEQRPKIWTPGN